MGILDFLKKKPKQAIAPIPAPPQPKIGGPEDLYLPPEPQEKTLDIPKPIPREMQPMPQIKQPTPKQGWQKKPIPVFKERINQARQRSPIPQPPKPPTFTHPTPTAQSFVPPPPPVQKSTPRIQQKIQTHPQGAAERTISGMEQRSPIAKGPKPTPRPSRPIHPREQPVFVGVDDFQSILNKIHHMRKTVADSEKVIKKLNDLKNQEEKLLENWRMRIEVVEKKINYVDTLIFKGE